MSYYDILEVSVKASKEVIKNAYRALCKKYHPDTYKGDAIFAQEQMKKINEAYEVLMDDNKRLQYDYDNGFKIDPNAIIEEVEHIEVKNRENEDIKNSNEDTEKSIIEIIKKHKSLWLIGIIILFILAFIIGGAIADKNDSEDKKEKEENKVKNEENINKENDSTNNNYYYYNTPQNNDIDEEIEEKPVQKEEKKEENKTDNESKENIDNETNGIS